jgi:type II secretory pathway pseudopilin PulG
VNKKVSGVSLAELIIAVGVLSIASAGLFTAFAAGLRQSTMASRMTTASIEAQLHMEQLMGREFVDDLEHIFADTSRIYQPNSDLWICVTRVDFPGTCPLTNTTNPRLVGVRVRVYEEFSGGNFLIEHRNMLDVYGY